MACSSSSSRACGARCHTLYASTRACGIMPATSSETRADTSGSGTNSAVLLDFGTGGGDDVGGEQDGAPDVRGHLLVAPLAGDAQDPLGGEEQIGAGAGHAGAIVMSYSPAGGPLLTRPGGGSGSPATGV